MNEPSHPASPSADDAPDPVLTALGHTDELEELGARRLLAALHRRLGVPSREQRIGRYVIRGMLGQGGAGVVWRAHDDQLGRDVAVKVLAPTTAPTADATSGSHGDGDVATAARLVREAQALAQIEHDNVVRVFDVGTHLDDAGIARVYLVMELVEGVSLLEWFRRRPSLRDVVDASIQAGRGLAAAHDRGIIHRDFKPGNAIIDRAGVVRVLDFGLARSEARSSIDMTGPVDGGAPEPLTRGDRVVGTPPYMAPEQLRGASVDARVDQYALCVTTFEGITGVRAFGQRDLSQLVAAKLRLELAAPGLGAVPPAVRAVLQRGLAADPDARFADMHALVAALRDTIAPRRRRAVALGAAALAIVGAALTIVAPWSPRASCTQGAPALRPWDPEAGARIAEAFAATGLALAESAAAEATRRLDGYSAALAQTWRSACATDLGAQARATTARCLEARQADLDDLVEDLASADPRAVVRSKRSVDRLADPARCRAPSATDLELHPARAELRHELRRQRRAIAGGKGDVPGLVSLIDAAIEAEDREVETQARLALGSVLVDSDQPARGHAELERAGLLAQANGDPDLAAEAWYFLAHEHASGGRGELAREALRHADAAAANTTADPSRERAAWTARWAIANAAGDYEEALDAAERAFEITAHLWGPDDARTSDASSRLGIALRRSGRGEEAIEVLEAGIARATAAFGADSPHLVTMLGNLARALAEQGQDEAAREQLLRASEILDARGESVSERRLTIDGELIGNLRRAERHDEAEQVANVRLGAIERDRAAPSLAQAMLRFYLGEVLVARGDLEGAVRRMEEALAMLRGLDERERRIHEVQRELARTLARAGRLAEALDLVSSAAVLAAQGANPDGPAAAETREALAELTESARRSLASLRSGAEAGRPGNRARIAALERALASAAAP